MATRWLRRSAAALVLVCGLGVVLATAQDPSRSAVLRIGTYDARAVAVAFAASESWNAELRAKMAEMKDAEASGDKARAAELKALGNRHQHAAHLQAFAGVRTLDALAPVKDQLPRVATEAGVVAITDRVDHAAAGVEVIDVTDEIVALFQPSDRTLRIVDDLKNKPPLSIDAVLKAEEKGGH